MRTKGVLMAVGLMLLATGCGTTAAAKAHPDYSIFKDVPASKLDAIKQVVKKEDIKNLEFPTEVPFKVTLANMPSPAINPVRPHIIEYLIANKQHVLDTNASTDNQKSINPNDIQVADNQVVTKLADGTKAVFGNNGAVTQLAWIKDGVFYLMASATGNINKSVPDLSEKQLIQIADSFN